MNDERAAEAGVSQPRPVLVPTAAAFIAGLVVARYAGWLWVWSGVAAAAGVVMLAMGWRGRRRGERAWRLVAVFAAAAAWAVLRAAPSGLPVDTYATEPATLVEVTGTVDGPSYFGDPHRGALGGFNYRPPDTLFALRVRTLTIDGEAVEASGGVLVDMPGADPRVLDGQRVRCRGWLSPIGGPMNPGEKDWAEQLARRGITARLSLAGRGNRDLLADRAAAAHPWPIRLRHAVADAAAGSLAIGMVDPPHRAEDRAADMTPEQVRAAYERRAAQGQRLGLMSTLLLGRSNTGGGGLGDLREDFRRVGLAHVLSISGAHLGILVGLVWLAARLFVPYPPRAAVLVLAVLGLYLLCVPWRVPILRAAIMAGVFCGAQAVGRRPNRIDLLCFAAMVVLAWRPGDVFSPGFQLSFGVVAALLLFATPVYERWWPAPTVKLTVRPVGWVIARWAFGYLVASVVAFLAALPVVAFHFGMVSPLAIVLSVFAIPFLTVLLAVGYVKIAVGVLLPSVGLVLAYPLSWLADIMTGLVRHAAGWPASYVELPRPVGLAWVLGGVAVFAAWASGRFRRRGWALGLALAAVVGWGVVEQQPPGWWGGPAGDDAVVIHSIAVGDGSCHVIRAGGQTWMFDCGSQQFLDAGSQSIAPALRELGVDAIDVMVLSHADFDHYSAALDVIDAVPVRRVLVPPDLLAEAATQRAVYDAALAAGDPKADTKRKATMALVEGLYARGIEPEPVTRGHVERWGGVTAAFLWPGDAAATQPDDHPANERSLVVRFTHHGAAALLVGDIEQEAITALLAVGDDLSAEVMEVPHHGDYVDATPALLDAVRPRVLLQSSGRRWRTQDRWFAWLATHPQTTRLITDRDGLITTRIAADGTVAHETFRSP